MKLYGAYLDLNSIRHPSNGRLPVTAIKKTPAGVPRQKNY